MVSKSSELKAWGRAGSVYFGRGGPAVSEIAAMLPLAVGHEREERIKDLLQWRQDLNASADGTCLLANATSKVGWGGGGCDVGATLHANGRAASVWCNSPAGVLLSVSTVSSETLAV